METSSALTLREGVLLAQLLAASAAQRSGARVLVIKGPRQVGLGLRPARESVDADVLVHPDEFEAALGQLVRLGWRRRVPDTSPHVLPFHSVALAHEAWPCEIDLHHRYPGFFASDAAVFEALWRRRRSDEVAGQQVPVCDLAGDTLIAALHAARAPERKRTDMEFLVATVRDRFDNETRRDLAVLAAETGCADTLRNFLHAVDAPTVGTGRTDLADLEKWSLLTAGESIRGIGWVHELGRAPWRHRPRLLLRAAFLTEAEVRSQYPQAPAGRWGLLRARFWRWRATARHVPRAVRALRTRRRGLD